MKKNSKELNAIEYTSLTDQSETTAATPELNKQLNSIRVVMMKQLGLNSKLMRINNERDVIESF